MAAESDGQLQPVDLRCEWRDTPLGLGETRPRLGWKLQATDPQARGLKQQAYEIVVASTPEQLVAGKGDLWTSGRVSSDQTQVVYAGAPLRARQDCWWKVRAWDQDGRARWSEPAHWTMGLLAPSDWQAEWIGFDAPADSALTDAQRERLKKLNWMRTTQPVSKTEPRTAWIRRAINIPGDRELVRATLLLLPDQTCAVQVNGRECTNINRWEPAQPIDLTPFLTPGENVLLLRVTQRDGYAPAVLGEIELAYQKHPPAIDAIGGGWQWTDSPPPPEASRPHFDDHTWQALAAIPDRHPPWSSPEMLTTPLPPAPLLRKTFAVGKPVRRATLYATALGLYEISLNGHRVGQDHFTPGWTDYAHRVPYQTYDVTGELRSGENAVAAILGDGWFAGTMAFTGQRQIYGGYPRLRAQLEIEYTDGSRAAVATDGSWRASVGPIRHADLYQGYAYDARQEPAGWRAPGFDDRSWHAVAVGLRPVATGSAPFLPELKVEATTVDPVQTTGLLEPRRITAPEPGVQVVDLGQNMVGWARLKVHGPAGRKIMVRHGEMLNPNGTVYTSNLRGAAATDVYWLRGDGEEVLEPRFTFHGFRYLEISGLDQPLTPDAVQGVVVHSRVTRTGEFSCSDPALNQLFANVIWGQRGNYLEIPTDCPQRDERLGWTGDTQFFIRTGAFNFDIAAFIERWLVTLSTDEQGEDGTFPDVAPSIGRKAHAITAWGDAAITCTHALWQVYGDTRVIERHFDELARYLGWLQAHAKDGIVRVGGYGDWLNKGGGAKTEVMDTAYYAHLAGLMSEMARAIGRNTAADYYAEVQRSVTAAWRRTFLRPDGSILDSSQTGFALAFAMDLLPDDVKSAAAQKFVDTIAAFNWHLATGFIGTPRLLPALHIAGRDDVAYRVLLQDTYPSWLFPVKQGATTIWERWDGWTPDHGFQDIGMNSFNHYAFGSVAEYLYRFVAGIDTDGPGFRRIIIAPQPGVGLTQARASYDSPAGKIISDWSVVDGMLTLNVTIPPNTTATIRVPADDPATVRENSTGGGAPNANRTKISTGSAAPGAEEFAVGSGSYSFTTRFTLKPATAR